jgi:hypothetical protein
MCMCVLIYIIISRGTHIAPSPRRNIEFMTVRLLYRRIIIFPPSNQCLPRGDGSTRIRHVFFLHSPTRDIGSIEPPYIFYSYTNRFTQHEGFVTRSPVTIHQHDPDGFSYNLHLRPTHVHRVCQHFSDYDDDNDNNNNNNYNSCLVAADNHLILHFDESTSRFTPEVVYDDCCVPSIQQFQTRNVC